MQGNILPCNWRFLRDIVAADIYISASFPAHHHSRPSLQGGLHGTNTWHLHRHVLSDLSSRANVSESQTHFSFIVIKPSFIALTPSYCWNSSQVSSLHYSLGSTWWRSRNQQVTQGSWGQEEETQGKRAAGTACRREIRTGRQSKTLGRGLPVMTILPCR